MACKKARVSPVGESTYCSDPVSVTRSECGIQHFFGGVECCDDDVRVVVTQPQKYVDATGRACIQEGRM